MMKIGFLISSVLLCALSYQEIKAQDAFIPGTVWTTYLEGTDYPDPSTGWETAELQAGCEGEDFMRMVVSCSYNRGSEEMFFIRKENGRIFFSNPSDQLDWQLLYDFNLEPEEGCEISSPWRVVGMPYLVTYDICSGTRVNDQGLTEMMMHEYPKYAEEDGYASGYGICKWFKGIGSQFGVMRPNYSEIVGAGFVLVEVRNGDTVFYSNPAAAKDLSINSEQVSVENGNLMYRDLPENTPVIICGSDGGIIAHKTVYGTGSMELAPGLNIVRVGETVLKGFGH